MGKRKVIPAFPSEAEEAQWWYKNRRQLDKDFEEAAAKGELRRLDRAALLARLRATRTVSIRLPEVDIARARLQAAKRGLPYQTYIKSLLHEALNRGETRKRA